MSRKRGNGEGCIHKLKDGRWEARIMTGYNEKGKPKFKTFSSKKRDDVSKKLADYISNQKAKCYDFLKVLLRSQTRLPKSCPQRFLQLRLFFSFLFFIITDCNSHKKGSPFRRFFTAPCTTPETAPRQASL